MVNLIILELVCQLIKIIAAAFLFLVWSPCVFGTKKRVKKKHNFCPLNVLEQILTTCLLSFNPRQILLEFRIDADFKNILFSSPEPKAH